MGRLFPEWKQSREEKKFVYIRGFTSEARDERLVALDKPNPSGTKLLLPAPSMLWPYIQVENAVVNAVNLHGNLHPGCQFIQVIRPGWDHLGIGSSCP